MSNITTINPADSRQIDTALDSLRALLPSPIASQQERDMIAATIAALPKRTEPEKTLVRVVALLRQYFVTDTAQSVIEVEAEDWANALAPFPDWAIRRACRWWQGADNPNRKRKPMIGDIEEICRNEVGVFDLAEQRISNFDLWDAICHMRRTVIADSMIEARKLVELIYMAHNHPDSAPTASAAYQAYRALVSACAALDAALERSRKGVM